MKLKKLDMKGAAHIIAPLLVIVGIGIVGSYMLVSSHASAAKINCTPNGKSFKGSAEYNCKFGPAPVFNSANKQVGTVKAGTNWVLCEQSSKVYYKDATSYSKWWAFTIASNGQPGWVNASYGINGNSNGGFSNVPACPSSRGAAPTTVGAGKPGSGNPNPGPSSGALPIPSSLPSKWTAPAGNFSMPTMVNVSTTVTVDLSAANITGTNGYLFNLKPGGNLTVIGGKFTGTISGLVQVSLPDGTAGSVTINGTDLTNARTVVFATAQGGPAAVTFTNVTASGLGTGIRVTSNAIDVEHSTLTGGGKPPSGNPAGVHSLDDNAGNVAVSGSYMKVFNSTITGFTSPASSGGGFPQGDSILGETRVGSADIENNVLGHNSDSGGVDSKIHSVVMKNNTIYSDGNRAIASHFGTLTSSGNTIYQVAKSLANGSAGKAYEATGILNASNDTVILTSGASLGVAEVVPKPGSGPASTYPRVGHIILTHIVDKTGKVLTGPGKASPISGYATPTVVINP